MYNVGSIELVEGWVFEDLQAFDPEDQERILERIDELEENVCTWGRDYRKVLDEVSGVSSDVKPVYRLVIGKSKFRVYFIRDGESLYCIGCGKRDTTYKRDIGTIQRRAREKQS